MVARPMVPHRLRASHAKEHPVHVTARAVDGLPSFRESPILSLVLLQMRRLNDARFQIVHFSVQTDHLHMICEADDGEILTRKMAGFMISFARRLNGLLARCGKVWSERFHWRDVTSAREMYNVLAYVFGNAKKHGIIPADALCADPGSSAWTFDGWDLPVDAPPQKARWTPPQPRTQLLQRDWITNGLLRLGAAPRMLKPPRA